MGLFSVRFRVSSLDDSARSAEIDGLVDTGACYPFIPGSTLERLGIAPTGAKVFTFADGSRKELPIGEVRFSYGGSSAPCLVVFGPAGSEPLFGALALESLGLEVDPVNQCLRPARLFLAAA